MPKWEYARLFFAQNAPKGASQWNLQSGQAIEHMDKTSLVEVLDHCGSEGWEAICSVAAPDAALLLKRPKP
jgi:hypothetical protein